MDHPRAERVAEGMRIIHRLLLSHTRPPRSVRAHEWVCVYVCMCVSVFFVLRKVTLSLAGPLSGSLPYNLL